MNKNKGYAYINLVEQKKNVIDLSLAMKVQRMEASPNVQEDSGRVALQRGPVIYCLEAVDNGSLLRDVRISSKASFELVHDDGFGAPCIKTKGYRRKISGSDKGLYKPDNSKLERMPLKFIPYFAFANRGESEMVVWVLKKS